MRTIIKSTNYEMRLGETNGVMDLFVIRDYDDTGYENNPNHKSLYELLTLVPGVTDTKYHGRVANSIFFTIDAHYDNTSTWKRIKELVQDYISGLYNITE